MATLAQAHKDNAAYYGTRPDWQIVIAWTRDSETLERANWQAANKRLAEWPDDVAIERSGHWAVGWVEYLVVRPGTEAATEAAKIQAELDDYPVLDDEILSEVEQAEIDSAIEQAAGYYARTNDLDPEKFIQAVYKAVSFEDSGPDCPQYAGADDYWPSDEFLARVATELR